MRFGAWHIDSGNTAVSSRTALGSCREAETLIRYPMIGRSSQRHKSPSHIPARTSMLGVLCFLTAFDPGTPKLIESNRVRWRQRFCIHWIAFRRGRPCKFLAGGWCRGSLRGPFQQRFRKPGLAFVPAFSAINDTIGPPARVRIRWRRKITLLLRLCIRRRDWRERAGNASCQRNRPDLSRHPPKSLVAAIDLRRPNRAVQETSNMRFALLTGLKTNVDRSPLATIDLATSDAIERSRRFLELSPQHLFREGTLWFSEAAKCFLFVLMSKGVFDPSCPSLKLAVS
jgi:hypothetical protein